MITGIDVRGADELSAKLHAFPDELADEIAEIVEFEAMPDFLDAIQDYPPQPAPYNENRVYIRGSGTLYVPTGKLYATSQRYDATAYVEVTKEGRDIVGTVKTPATYSIFLRGTTTGRPPAWMHPAWESLTQIIARVGPAVLAKLQQRINDFIDFRLTGGW